jgi:hypothetical protein
MSLVEFSDANVTSPYKNTSTLACIWADDVDTTSDETDLTTVFGQFSSGDWITVANDGTVTIYVAFGSAAGTIASAATGVGATVCWPIPAGAQIPYRVVGAFTFLHYITATGTSTIRVYRSSLPPQGKPEDTFPAVGVI